MSGAGALQPQQRVWVGDLADPARPPEAVTPALHACCGECYPSYIECVDPMLCAMVTAVACTICPHRDTDLLCSSCGLRVLMLTERIRNTWRFSLEGLDWYMVTLAILRDHGLLTLDDCSRLQVIYRASEKRGWGGALAEDALAVLLRSQSPTDATAHRVIESFFPVASGASTWSNQPLEPVQPRTSPSIPPRKWYQRAELEIAQAQGWPEPQRFMLERRVRTAALKAWSEADFVRNLLADGLAAFPRLNTAGFGVCGYSVADPGIPAAVRTTFAGASLAPDLTLPRLRRAWDSAAADEDAWATWVSLAVPAVIDADPLQPAVPADGGWRWVHPSLQRQPVTTDTSAWQAGSRPPRPVVWEVLLARQAGRCAMCSIRRYHWERVYGSAVPEGLLAVPAHVDHYHDTGLVRGLLCAYCNTVREPWEAGFQGDVWSTYVAEPPAAPYGWQFYAQPRR